MSQPTHTMVIATVDFERALRAIEQGLGICAIGVLVSSHTGTSVQWSAHQWKVLGSWPRGADFPFVFDWFVLIPGHRGGTDLSKDGIERFAPLSGQNLIVLTLGTGADQSGWNAVRFEGRRATEVDEVRFSGAPPFSLERDTLPSQDDDHVANRWSRLTHALGKETMKTLRQQHVMLIGASRNGSLMARELAAIGLTRLSLVDHDILESHNFDAMLGGDISQIGTSKVHALASELIRFRDDMAITCLPWRATDRKVIQHARQADIIITCVDHSTPVFLAAKMANRWNKIHLDIGTNVQHSSDGGLKLMGDARLFLPHEACAVCVGGIADLNEAQRDMKLPAGTREIRRPIPFHQSRAGSLITINNVTISMAVQAFIECLAGMRTTSVWIRIDCVQASEWHVLTHEVTGTNDCTIHKITNN